MLAHQADRTASERAEASPFAVKIPGMTERSAAQDPPRRDDPLMARLAWVAARLAGAPAVGVPEWAAKHVGVTVPKSAIEKHVNTVTARSNLMKPRGRPGQTRIKRDAPIMRDWVLVDESALGLRVVLFRLSNDGLPQRQLLADLRDVRGVRQIIETSADRELLAVAVVRGIEHARDMRARFEELAPGRSVRMDFVEFETHEPAIATWLDLAKLEVDG